MSKIKVLWADDEIDLLKPQLFFLEKKGYDVITVTNGHDALDVMEEDDGIHVVFLDESMPGLTGLETLAKIKEINPNIPVVMITKNEAENLMEEAIGSQIDDYLIKPVNPNQILLTLKKIIDNKRLVSQKTASDYQQEFQQIMMDVNSGLDYTSWAEIYKKLISWELRLDESNVEQMMDILAMQKSEANRAFGKYIEKNYEDWITNRKEAPIMSHNLMKERILPKVLDSKKPSIMLLFDNLRYDQWKVIKPIITELYQIQSEETYYSILPTSTQYSRNAIFAGLLPSEIEKRFPDKWIHDFEEGGKNNFEKDFLEDQLERLVHKPIKSDYVKVTTVQSARNLNDQIHNYLQNDLTVIVYNFIDMLSHARTEMEVLKELAGDEKAYRSLTKSWFLNSPIWSALQKISKKDVKLFITTDHGTIRVGQPSRVIADKNTTKNLRYKMGKNLQFDKKDVFLIADPKKVGLSSPNISSRYIFAKDDKFFLYPNNFNYFNNFFNNTFQHGGISLEEVICPIVALENK